MRELNQMEMASVDGGSLASDIGYAIGHGIGTVLGDAVREGMCEMINSQFQQQYG